MPHGVSFCGTKQKQNRNRKSKNSIEVPNRCSGPAHLKISERASHCEKRQTDWTNRRSLWEALQAPTSPWPIWKSFHHRKAMRKHLSGHIGLLNRTTPILAL